MLVSKKRFIVVMALLALLYIYAIVNVYFASFNNDFSSVVANQSQSSALITTSKGTIYDCALRPLTNVDESTLAVVMPDTKSIDEAKKITNYLPDPSQLIQDGKPYSIKVDVRTDGEYVDFFEVPQRYEEESLASNLIGYIDGSGNGVTGIEKAFDEILSKTGGSLVINYTSNAIGNMILGEERSYENTLDISEAGIALTIDREIQEVAQSYAENLEKGAVVVLSSPDAQIKAVVSTPTYNQNELDVAFESEDAPMVNRAFSAFAPGSVFKLVMATAALNSGVDPDEEFVCTGETVVDGISMSCFNDTAHGSVNLHTAVQHSCNSYFINLGFRLSSQVLYETAINFGLGVPTKLYEEYYSDSGNIPSAQTLQNGTLANFSIGQGDVTVTPLQVASVVNTIISEGIYTAPSVYLGEVSDDKEIIPYTDSRSDLSVMEKTVADKIKSYMESAAKYGTGREGAVEGYTIGTKTGTAQTGILVDEKALLNYWYAGYVTDGEESYVIVVLDEGATRGENPTASVFKGIAEYIASNYMPKEEE